MKSSPAAVWSLDGRRFSVRASDSGLFAFSGLTGTVEADGTVCSLNDASILSDFEKDADFEAHEEYMLPCGIRWIRKARTEGDSVLLETVLRNESEKDIRIGSIGVLGGQADAGASFSVCGDLKDVRFFRWIPWSMAIEDFDRKEQPYSSCTLFHISDAATRRTLQISFVTVDRMNCLFQIDYGCDTGFRAFSSVCRAEQYRLRPGMELRGETVRIQYFDAPETALETWADEVNARYKPDFEGTAGIQLGCGSWGDLYTTDRYDLRDLEDSVTHFIDEELGGFGMKFIHAGTHYLMKDGIPGNWLAFEPRRNGPGTYVDMLLDGVRRGWTYKLWFSPFWFFGEAEQTLEENRENLLKYEDGTPVVFSFENGWEFGRGRFSHDVLHQYFLDGTHPKTAEYLRKVFTQYRALGARGYMMDFLAIVPGAKPYDDTKLPVEASRQVFRIIREAAGRDTHIQTAVASSPCFIGCVNSARVVRDFGESRPQAPFPNWQNSNYCFHDYHFANIHSFMQNASAAWFTNRKVYVNDLNALLIDQPIPLEFARMAVTMFGLYADSPVAIADDLRTLAPDRMRMLKQILPRTKGIPEPVDLFDRTTENGGCHILKKAISTSYDNYMLVAVFHSAPAADAIREEVDFARLGLDPEKKYTVYEFWNSEYYGIYRKSFSCNVPPGCCKLFRITEKREYPWLISSDFHVEQGNAEIESLAYDEKTLTLRGVARRPKGEYGRLVFLMPRTLKLKHHERINTMKEVIDMQTVISLPIRFSSDRETFELEFEKLDTCMVARPGWLEYSTEAEWLEYVEKHRSQYPANRVIE